MGGPTTEPQLLPSLVVDDTTVTVATTTGNNTDVDSEYSRQSLGETCEVQIELYRRWRHQEQRPQIKVVNNNNADLFIEATTPSKLRSSTSTATTATAAPPQKQQPLVN